jgi:diacylglycerol kinase family enzyme
MDFLETIRTSPTWSLYDRHKYPSHLTSTDTQLVVTEKISSSSIRVNEIELNDVVYVVTKSVDTVKICYISYPGCVRTEFLSGCFLAPGGCGGSRASKRKAKDRKIYSILLHLGQHAFGFCEMLNARVFGVPKPEPKRALVVVNPVAGKGTAKSDWCKNVEPLLRESGKFIYEVIVTTHKGHGLTIGSEHLNEPGRYDFLITLGGDGILFELLNGAFKFIKSYESVLSNLVISPLPSGSGNGVCFSTLCLAGEPFTINCALRQLLRGNSCPKDLGVVSYTEHDAETFQDASVSRIFSLTVSWGLVADVDIKSEFLRKFFGDSRFTLYGLFRVLKNKLYSGQIHWDNEQHEIEPDYITVYASLVPVAARSVILDPEKELSSGMFDIYRLRGQDIGRGDLVNALEEMSKRRNHSNHIKGFDPIHAKNFELIPQNFKVDSDSAGIVVDGEPLTSGPIHVHILPRATRCLCE